jgi:hypothetical protein
MTQRTPLARLRGFKPISEIVWLKRYPSRIVVLHGRT